MQKSARSILLLISSIIIVLSGLFSTVQNVAYLYISTDFFYVIWPLIQALIYVLVGIIGVLSYKQPARRGFCMKLGIMMLVFEAINMVLNLMVLEASLAISYFILGIVLPALYFVGAMWLIKEEA